MSRPLPLFVDGPTIREIYIPRKKGPIRYHAKADLHTHSHTHTHTHTPWRSLHPWPPSATFEPQYSPAHNTQIMCQYTHVSGTQRIIMTQHDIIMTQHDIIMTQHDIIMTQHDIIMTQHDIIGNQNIC